MRLTADDNAMMALGSVLHGPNSFICMNQPARNICTERAFCVAGIQLAANLKLVAQHFTDTSQTINQLSRDACLALIMAVP